MATPNVKNVIVGAANVFVSASYGNNRPAEPSWNTASSAATSLRGSTSSWVETGLTTEGIELSYEPTYGEVTVDQLLDVAKIFKQSLKVTLKTTLAEATLTNLEFAFGNAGTVAFNTSSTVMSLPAGAIGSEPIERSLIFVSQYAPDGPVWGASGSADLVAGQNTERVYFARRVVSMETSAHSLKRDAATVFPVTFRVLPDTATTNAGSEYGKIIDRLYTGTQFSG